ncbi:MAG: hypothetical protein JNJ73_20025 [Hyphomonadaceae bacterium]|nr:hypothetical protein [Hyphomonadaceae bacterium]
MLKTIVLAAALAATSLTATAFAEDLTDANYATAARCIALAGQPQLASDGFDVAGLQAAFHQQAGRRSPAARAQAREAERAANRIARRSPEAILRVQREQACSAFVTMGLANNGQTAAGSAPSMP